MDPFALVLVGAVALLILWLWLLGKYHPGTGLEPHGLRSARESSEHREALEAEELDQLLGAHNARRRTRGEAPLSVRDLELHVSEDQDEQRRRDEEVLAQRELDELLGATNARRRARGLPERTRAEARAEFGARPTPER